MYDFEDFTLDVRYFKQVPQFANLTTQEIQALLARIIRWENDAYYANRDARLVAERTEDSCYAETCKDPFLPEGEVEIRKGILIVPNTVDDRGFVSNEVLASGLKRFKFSMPNKGKFYL